MFVFVAPFHNLPSPPPTSKKTGHRCPGNRSRDA